jgi:urease gamma subunit
MSTPEPTPADIEWMAQRAKDLREARLKKLGHGAKLSQPEEDAILTQAIIDGAKHAVDVRERSEHQALMDKRKRDEQARAEGKSTLRATFGELIERAAKR